MLTAIIEKELTISDLEDSDEKLGQNLKWILNNNVEDLYLTFSHEIDILGERITVELCEGGFDIFVDEANKADYVKKICEAKMTTGIEKQLKAFLKGFRTILPHDCYSHLSAGELEIIIAGAPQIDLADMKKYVELNGYTKQSEQIKWLWEILEEFSQEELAAFLYFVSGKLFIETSINKFRKC